MKKFLLISVVLLSVLFSGCGRIISKYIKLPDLGDGYQFTYETIYSLAIVNPDNILVINATILEYAFDSTFIIVSQRPRDSIPNISTMNYYEATDAFENSTFRQYWIINKKEKSEYIVNRRPRYSNIYGPFNKKDYLKKRIELNVPKELELIEIEHY